MLRLQKEKPKWVPCNSSKMQLPRNKTISPRPALRRGWNHRIPRGQRHIKFTSPLLLISTLVIYLFHILQWSEKPLHKTTYRHPNSSTLDNNWTRASYFIYKIKNWFDRWNTCYLQHRHSCPLHFKKIMKFYCPTAWTLLHAHDSINLPHKQAALTIRNKVALYTNFYQITATMCHRDC